MVNIRDILDGSLNLDSNNREFLLVVESKSLNESRIEKIPGSNKTGRYEPGNTNTRTQDHYHVFAGPGNQLYAINRDGSPHDGSRARLGGKEVAFFRGKGFIVPDNGMLEWITLSQGKAYTSFELLQE